jgi:glycosyltransferase involved in cell wall biosynthesis
VKTQPLVSVLVPTYNHARFVASCLDSVARDPYPNRELLVLDDGSQDDTFDVVKDWIARNQGSFVRAICRTQENQGVGRTANRLVQEARGTYLSLLASDDELVSGGIQARVDALERHPRWLAVFGGAVVIDDAGRVTAADAMEALYGTDRAMLLGRESLAIELILRWGVPGPVLMARREAFDAAAGVGPFAENLPMEDRDFYLRLLARGGLGYADATVARYRLHGSNASSNAARSPSASRRFRAALLESSEMNLQSFMGFSRMSLQAHINYLRAHAINDQSHSRSSWLKLAARRAVVELLLRGARAWFSLARIFGLTTGRPALR